MKELITGTETTVKDTVSDRNTALTMGSGTLPVLATPAVAALMEQAACTMLTPYLPEGITTVGTELAIRHISASPIGADISATAVLTEIDGRCYRFDVKAFDNGGLIAEGTHTRFSVKSDSFVQKAAQKIN